MGLYGPDQSHNGELMYIPMANALPQYDYSFMVSRNPVL